MNGSLTFSDLTCASTLKEGYVIMLFHFFKINWSVSLQDQIEVCGLLTKMSLTPVVYCMLIQCSHKWYIMSAHHPSPVHTSFGSSLFEIQVGVFQNVFSVKVSIVEYIPDQP